MERAINFTGSLSFEAFISLKLETSHRQWNCPLSELLSAMLENFTSTHFQQESHYVGLSAEGSLVQGSASFGLSVDVYTCLDQQPEDTERAKQKESTAGGCDMSKCWVHSCEIMILWWWEGVDNLFCNFKEISQTFQMIPFLKA